MISLCRSALSFPLRVEGLLKNPAPQEKAMADRRTRRRFTPECKVQAVKRVLDGRSLLEVATELGLSTGQLSTWRTEHFAAGCNLVVRRKPTKLAA
jgi:hypothetical protein